MATNGAKKLVEQWDAGNIVACKQSLAAAQRYLKQENDLDTQDGLCNIIEYTRFHERENYYFKNWKLKDES